MATARASRHIHTIPTGAPFLPTFARAFAEGRIIPGFPDPDDPLSLATAVVYVPTNRAARILAREFLAISGRRAIIPPSIVPLGRLETLEPDNDPDSAAPGPSDRTIGAFERRLALATLIRKWAAALSAATASGPAFDPFIRDHQLIGASFASAWALAGELADLIDEFYIEGVDWSRIDGLVPDEFDQYWGITRRFLTIAGEAWPLHLRELGAVDRVQWQVAMADAEIARIASGRARGPIAVVGSTGANATTARLMAAVARHPRGALVLPGLDLGLDDHAWRLLADTAVESEPLATHPQSAMARLLAQAGLDRSEVGEVARPPAALAQRNRFLSEALRPAETTDSWFAFRRSGGLAATSPGLAEVAVALAADEREEALCAALKLRECVELGRAAALVTPDRDIARRVKAELSRWGVEVDDSGGDFLSRSAPGALAGELLMAVSSDAGNVDHAAILSRDIARLGLDADICDRVKRIVDLALLRRVAAHPNVAALDDADWSAADALLTAYEAALTPLRGVGPVAPIDAWADAHRRCVERTAAGGEPEALPGWRELGVLFDEMSAHGGLAGELRFDEYAAFFRRAMAEVVVRAAPDNGRKVRLLGLLEARLLHFDTVVMAGFDEGIWPPKTPASAFLNRAMRAALGLSSPDRRIGQTAHDLVQALGAPDVFIARSLKREGAPTVPSRFAQRVAALLGETPWAECLGRGSRYVALARRIDVRPSRRVPPPAPRPPLRLRPQNLSVTRVETLRRDPYSIYAEKILRLRSLDPLQTTPGPREYGTALHETISEFAADFHRSGGVRPPLENLLALARVKFELFLGEMGFEEFGWPRLERVLAAYHAWEILRAGDVSGARLELGGGLKFELDDATTFNLTARADRIETSRDGVTTILDFKSGRLPTTPEIEAGFAPQLVLEAKMALDGAFGPPPRHGVAALYVKLGGADLLKTKAVGSNPRDLPLDELIASQFNGLKQLLNQLRDVETPYMSRPYPRFTRRFGEFDHLARVKEWSADGDSEAVE